MTINWFCAICGDPSGSITTKALNGLPVGVIACDDCRQAVRRREVGVTIRGDGSLSITDARKRVSA